MAELNMLGQAHRRIEELLAENTRLTADLQSREEENAALRANAIDIAILKGSVKLIQDSCMSACESRDMVITALREEIEQQKELIGKIYADRDGYRDASDRVESELSAELADKDAVIVTLRNGLEKIASEVPAATVFDGLKVVWLDDFWSMQRIARDLLSSTTEAVDQSQ